MKRRSRKSGWPGHERRRKRGRTIWRPRTRARGIRRCPAGFSFAFKRLQHVFGQRGVEVVRHGELAFGETDGAELQQRRWVEDGEQAGRFLRQGLRAFGRNVSVVNFNFNGQITHGTKLRFRPAARKRGFAPSRLRVKLAALLGELAALIFHSLFTERRSGLVP